VFQVLLSSWLSNGFVEFLLPCAGMGYRSYISYRKRYNQSDILRLRGASVSFPVILSPLVDEQSIWCNDPTIGSYNHYHLCPNGIQRGNQRWYGPVYIIQIAGKPRIRPRQLLSSLEVLY